MTKKVSGTKHFKAELDKRLAESLRDIREGRVFGPFKTADELIRSLRRNAKRLKKR